MQRQPYSTLYTHEEILRAHNYQRFIVGFSTRQISICRDH